MMLSLRLIWFRALPLITVFMTDAAMQAHATALPDAAIMLRHDIQQELGAQATRPRPRQTQRAVALATDILDHTAEWPQEEEVVLIVDRAPAVQLMWIVLTDPAAHRLLPLGMVSVSTGRPGRKEHFRTPAGIFFNDGQIYGYRAQGTKNEHGIRGNGEKGMRVWDFGWQTTEDWRRKGAVAVVRLEMHATDPTFLESRLGQADSEGCIRIPARVNSFIDRHGLLDRQLDLITQQDDPQKARAVRALLGANHIPTPLEGDRVIVVDSSDPNALLSDPAAAQRIQDSFAQFLAATASPPAGSTPSSTPAPAPTTTSSAVPQPSAATQEQQASSA
ncbi:L,D-transpeptidase, partial [Komagataeibacter intermedius]